MLVSTSLCDETYHGKLISRPKRNLTTDLIRTTVIIFLSNDIPQFKLIRFIRDPIKFASSPAHGAYSATVTTETRISTRQHSQLIH
jgi:hypothetical protein